jgi:hypothetical protein
LRRTLDKIVGAQSFALGGELVFFNGGFRLDAERVAGFAIPPANGLFLLGIIIVAGQMLGKIPTGVPGRRLGFDGYHIAYTPMSRSG